ncbi:glutathione S-transferase family protein [Tropicimonas sp. IMCC6043]|uniref:glutathione S-transferase family protein n=1 Tax=Tropicimonas sp. IMCC6043 TaxID=2510645 RepID=UPI00101C3024|nr:glutathione S-transferase family protein [Tropicimonas sp. IMCC6043]RYH11785.1 glutathione S-transferase family protein [Tropicimonas sp. IMCC6043]
MGLLIDGNWQDKWYDTEKTGGAFKRSEAGFRNWITTDGAPGPTGEGGFAAESGRYHLYVSYACPWAHRTLIYRSLKGLEDHISVSVVHPHMLSEGWSFDTDFPGATGDHLYGLPFLRDVYLRDTPDMTGRVTVPVLWDKAQERIVSNESAEIIRMFGSAFDTLTGNRLDLLPADRAGEVDAINERVYAGLNNGVYRAGFATRQHAYDAAVADVFETLDWMEDRLSRQRFLAGDRTTEADWRAFTTLVRFDTVYHGHFKCARNRLADMPNLFAYTRELYQWPGVAATVNFEHIRQHYYYSHDVINPTRVVPIAPRIDWESPHGREELNRKRPAA